MGKDFIESDNYEGPSRREGQRRINTDRRTDIRFEPGKEDRRKNAGRRKGDGDIWRQHEE